MIKKNTLGEYFRDPAGNWADVHKKCCNLLIMLEKRLVGSRNPTEQRKIAETWETVEICLKEIHKHLVKEAAAQLKGRKS